MKIILTLQAIYFLITGIWPLVHIRSFMKVTGPKKDIWLVKTVGCQVIAVALTLLAGLYFGITLPIVICAMASALAFLGIDVYYALKGIIAKIYLADAAIQMLLISFWTGWFIHNY